jgi:hypothetical protein
MLQINIEIAKDFKDLITTDELKREVYKILIDYGNAVKQEAQQRVPKVTRNLCDSIIEEPDGEYGVSVGTSVEYSKYVEPEPLGVPMKRKMKRTPYLYVSALNNLKKYENRIIYMLHKKLFK